MRYRSRTELISQILEAATGSGITKTRLMYKAFLSYQQLKEYLRILIENGLIEYDQPNQLYKTTDKGHKFLKIYNQLNEFVTANEQEK